MEEDLEAALKRIERKLDIMRLDCKMTKNERLRHDLNELIALAAMIKRMFAKTDGGKNEQS